METESLSNVVGSSSLPVHYIESNGTWSRFLLVAAFSLRSQLNSHTVDMLLSLKCKEIVVSFQMWKSFNVSLCPQL